MPILDLVKTGYVHSENKWGVIRNGLTAKNQMFEELQFIKANKNPSCFNCGRNFGKGARYVGNNWNKICSNCFKEWQKNSLEEIDKIRATLVEMGEEYDDCIDKWKTEEMLGSLADNGPKR